MPIELTCPGCGKQLRLADEHAGKPGRCPACQATFQIPAHGEAQTPASPFGGSAPTQPFGSSPASGGNLFGEQNKPNPFASTSGMQSPYGGVNPYSSASAPNMYGAPAAPGEGMATASMVLGIVSIVFAFLPCCCYTNLLIGVPCGIIGIILAFQVPPERRKVGLILNIVGLGLIALFFVAYILFIVVVSVNQPQQQPQFNFGP